MLGVFVYGFKLIRMLQMEQIVRDLGHMYVRGVNFRTPAAVQVAQTLASGFALTSGGTSEVILSQVEAVQQGDCDAGNPGNPPGQPCPNLGQPVYVEQLILGNASDGNSTFGVPPLQADHTVSPADRANNGAARAGGFSSVLALRPGEIACVAEMINLTPELNISGFPGKPLIYARSIF
jgi:hypothetical protein